VKSVAIDHAQLERIAHDLCTARRGASAWNRKGCKRNHWRKLAAVEISQSHAVSLADAFMGIFGFKRAGQ
jgi:hypothetical protein